MSLCIPVFGCLSSSPSASSLSVSLLASFAVTVTCVLVRQRGCCFSLRLPSRLSLSSLLPYFLLSCCKLRGSLLRVFLHMLHRSFVHFLPVAESSVWLCGAGMAQFSPFNLSLPSCFFSLSSSPLALSRELHIIALVPFPPSLYFPCSSIVRCQCHCIRFQLASTADVASHVLLSCSSRLPLFSLFLFSIFPFNPLALFLHIAVTAQLRATRTRCVRCLARTFPWKRPFPAPQSHPRWSSKPPWATLWPTRGRSSPPTPSGRTAKARLLSTLLMRYVATYEALLLLGWVPWSIALARWFLRPTRVMF